MRSAVAKKAVIRVKRLDMNPVWKGLTYTVDQEKDMKDYS